MTPPDGTYSRRMDRIHIRNLEVMGILGVNPEERVDPQPIRVSATLGVDISAAAASDDIDDAVNYRTVTKAMIAHIESGAPSLVERLARELTEVCLGVDDRVAEVEMTVEKPTALRHTESVGITIHRRRQEPASGRAAR